MSSLNCRALRVRTFQRRSSGFTLIEILVTILVIGILAAVAAPRFSDAKLHFSLRAAAQRIRSDLELARASARSAGRATAVTFDVASNSYSLTNVADMNHATSPYQVDLTEVTPSASIVSVSLSSGGNVISFDIHGRPDRGGTIVLQSGTQRLTLTIDAATGSVTMP